MAMWAILPPCFKRTFQAVGTYVAVTFAAAVGALRHGSPELRDGRYLAGSHKLAIPYRAISEEEYWRLEAHAARMLVGLGVVITLVSVVAFAWERIRDGYKPR
jgi:hypothetical protein